jgi:tetratricopeptide (TPR) repeat protein
MPISSNRSVSLILVGILIVAGFVYLPSQKSEFVLDDYYTVVRNPLIKNPSLYQNIWISRLFDAYQSCGYIKFGYWRPLLTSSWILDYRLFGLRPVGYKWINLLIHLINCFLIYVLFRGLFGQEALALKACFLFAVFPTQEWVVRYVTGRGDELSAMFALLALAILSFPPPIKIRLRRDLANPKDWRTCGGKLQRESRTKEIILAFVFWALAALTREVALSYILYVFLIYKTVIPAISARIQGFNHFCFYWILIGLLPVLIIWPIIPKLGVLALHMLYFASIGFCLWMAQLRLRWVVLLVVLFSAVSFYQGRFWRSEEVLLRHTQSLDWWPRTVTRQQLLMKYDDDIAGINDLETRARDPLIKAMWLRRLGLVYYKHGDLSSAQTYFIQALNFNPADVDSLNALAVVAHDKGQDEESLKYLDRALAINPFYPDTLRTLGIYYYVHKDFVQARAFLARCLIFDPDNPQARQLLNLANKMF